MIKSKRIDALVFETKGIKTLLDIGCDHGFVIKKALDLQYIETAIAVDINSGPLQSAKDNLKDYPVKFVQSDGFKMIKDTFDGVVIAGMGSTLISNILNEAPKGEITYILQSNSKYEVLRKYLASNNYKIIDEIIVYDKHYYIIIKAIRGKQQLTDEEIYLGPALMKKQSSKKYYQHTLDKYYQLINLEGARGETILQNVKWLEDIIERL